MKTGILLGDEQAAEISKNLISMHWFNLYIERKFSRNKRYDLALVGTEYASGELSAELTDLLDVMDEKALLAASKEIQQFKDGIAAICSPTF